MFAADIAVVPGLQAGGLDPIAGWLMEEGGKNVKLEG